MRSSHNGKFVIEYAVLMAVAMAGLVSMAVYVKGGIAGRWREAGDMFGHGKQYEPGQGSFDCRAERVYTCGTPCTLICSAQPSPICQPICYYTIGFGLSNASMAAACAAAVADANSRGTPACRTTPRMCGWITYQYTYDSRGNLKRNLVCPGPP